MLGLGTPELLILLVLIISAYFYFNRNKFFASDLQSAGQVGSAPAISPVVTNGEEKIVLESDDKSITLTTQRLIQRGGINNEIDLKDISSYEIQKNFKMIFKVIIPVLFGCLPFTFAFDASIRYMQVVIGGLVVSFIVMFLYPEKKLKIVGAYGIVQFSVSHLSESALSNFISTMNEYRKKLKEN